MTIVKAVQRENKEGVQRTEEKNSGSERPPTEGVSLEKIPNTSTTPQQQSTDATNNHSSLVSIDGQCNSQLEETQESSSQQSLLLRTLPTKQRSSAGLVSIPSSESEKESERPMKKFKQDGTKREERNAREKERSFRIAQQITELRNLLSSGGIIVPKGTKSSVLTEAGNYIRKLQQQKYESEIERQKLVKHIQMMGGGTLGMQSSPAVNVTAQSGVWPLGSFSGVPQKTAMQHYQDLELQNSDKTVDVHTFKLVFNACSVGMAIASMGGAFVDCNPAFCQLSKYNRHELCSRTIFNLTNRQDLEKAFDVISQMISPPRIGCTGSDDLKPCVLRGSMKNGCNLGLNVALIKGDNNIAKCFCVTLIENPSSLSDSSKPVPASSETVEKVK